MILTKEERVVIWAVRFLAVSFAAVGLTFILLPDQILTFTDLIGRRLGDFVPAP
jgi:hypothetical protein